MCKCFFVVHGIFIGLLFRAFFGGEGGGGCRRVIGEFDVIGFRVLGFSRLEIWGLGILV